MLGKRGRPPMKRTTSMTEFTLDFNEGHDHVINYDAHNPFHGGGYGGLNQLHLNSAAASPRPRRRNSTDLAATADFLRVCTLCKHRLIPGHDIYMYRGDSAFCSLECRQQQMSQDEERKENYCSVASKTAEPIINATATGPQASATAETVSAV